MKLTIPPLAFLAVFALLAFEPDVQGQTAPAITTLHSFTGKNRQNPRAGLVQDSDGNFYGTTYNGGSEREGTVFKLTPAGAMTTLHNFTSNGPDGARPYASLTRGSDGSFYGTTYFGGSSGFGTAFKITAAGVYTTLHSFARGGTDGAFPESSLLQGSDGNFYGTTRYGGSEDKGVIFRITAAGAFSILLDFTASGTDGLHPYAGLIQGSDGSFYGTTHDGASRIFGTVFKVTAAGVYTTLHGFGSGGTDGAYPEAGLVQGSDGNFYGTTVAGGQKEDGVVFKMTPAGAVTILHSFTSNNANGDGAKPVAGLVEGSNGIFYGTAERAGGNGYGTVFKITAAGVYTALHSFASSGTNGAFPEANLIQGSDGDLYGTTEYGGSDDGGTVFKITPGGTYTTVHSFLDSTTDGAYPQASLARGSDGSFFGTTPNGGPGDVGTVFRITAAGGYSRLHVFTDSGTDGAVPLAGLIRASDGAFYGTTQYGGSDRPTFQGSPNGFGTVFKITAAGVYSTVYSFKGNNTGDGAFPEGGVIQGSDGNFYGTTAQGGSHDGGSVFKVTPSGVRTILHSFDEGGLISNPAASLVQGSNGDFYGITTSGGTSSFGSVFKITAAGVYTLLHSFTDAGTDGAVPQAGLVEGSDGNFYGTTQYGGSGALTTGGAPKGYGAIYKITPAGAYTTLYSFKGFTQDGAAPVASLLLASDGNFYGTAAGGGANSRGIVFKITPAGGYSLLYNFGDGSTDPAGPAGALFQNSDGSFYGTTAGGGSSGFGTVYKLTLTPVITSPVTATATAGSAFSYQITATNNPTSYATSSVPPGLSFSTSTGKFTGTPTKAGTYKPLLTAINGLGKGSVNLNLVVREAAPVITSATSAKATVGKAFSYQITATNSPKSYATSSIPPGLSFSTTTGRFTGTPTRAGTYKPLLSAMNSTGTARVNLNLTVNPAAPVITSALTESAQVGMVFNYQVTATNSPTGYAISSLPPGLTFNATTGKLSGTPTKAGSYRPLVSASNSGGTGSANVDLTVKPAKPVITSDLNPPARQGVPFSYQITATNGPTSYATSSIPPGLDFNAGTGRFGGTPAKAGTYKPLVSATNSGGTASVNLNLVVKPPQ